MRVQRWMEREVWGHVDPMRCQEFGGKWIDGTEYNHGGPPRYPVPAIPIDVSWDDVNLGYVDMWIGADNGPITHIEFRYVGNNVVMRRRHDHRR